MIMLNNFIHQPGIKNLNFIEKTYLNHEQPYYQLGVCFWFAINYFSKISIDELYVLLDVNNITFLDDKEFVYHLIEWTVAYVTVTDLRAIKMIKCFIDNCRMRRH